MSCLPSLPTPNSSLWNVHVVPEVFPVCEKIIYVQDIVEGVAQTHFLPRNPALLLEILAFAA